MTASAPSPDPVFRLNQEDYAAGLPVHAAVLGEGEVFLLDEKGDLFRTIGANVPRLDEASGDRVRLLTFSSLPEGKWTLACGENTRTFTVKKQPWRRVVNALIKGLYYQRCGCALDKAHAGIHAHPPCHTAAAVDWEDRSVRRCVPGGWHDAGDYGKYVGPGAVAAAHLLYAFLLFPEGCGDPLDIPESGSGRADILSEALYEIQWLMKMQRSDGAFHHKLTKASFAPFIMPQDDRETEYLMPVSHCATAAACACLALGSRIFRAADAPLANSMLFKARQAWQWLEANPSFVPFRNPEGVRTGQYGDGSDADERFWAACELYAATGEPVFREAAEALYARGLSLTRFGWSDVWGLGALCCLFVLKERAGEILYTELRRAFLEESERVLALSRRSGYGTALSPEGYVWGSILPIMSGAMAMIVHYLLTGRQDMLSGALLQWDYALGLNALDTCFVTGFGTRRVLHPHHRPSGADGISDPVPGLISGGPNRRFPYAATRERLGSTPPAKYFLDETPSADTNEIAVYWNSPTVFVGACMNQLSITLTGRKTE